VRVYVWARVGRYMRVRAHTHIYMQICMHTYTHKNIFKRAIYILKRAIHIAVLLTEDWGHLQTSSLRRISFSRRGKIHPQKDVRNGVIEYGFPGSQMLEYGFPGGLKAAWGSTNPKITNDHFFPLRKEPYTFSQEPYISVAQTEGWLGHLLKRAP